MEEKNRSSEELKTKTSEDSQDVQVIINLKNQPSERSKTWKIKLSLNSRRLKLELTCSYNFLKIKDHEVLNFTFCIREKESKE